MQCLGRIVQIVGRHALLYTSQAARRVVEEDADESLYWMEILIDAEINPMSRLKDLMTEREEVLSIIVASIRTTKEER